MALEAWSGLGSGWGCRCGRRSDGGGVVHGTCSAV